jgi:hypothetical protein
MTIEELVRSLLHYPKTHIATISKDSKGNNIIVAVDPERYEQDNRVLGIDSVIPDRRATSGRRSHE